MKYEKESEILEKNLRDQVAYEAVEMSPNCRQVIAKINYNLAANNYSGKEVSDLLYDTKLDLNEVKELKKYYKKKRKELRYVLNTINMLKDPATKNTMDRCLKVFRDHMMVMAEKQQAI